MVFNRGPKFQVPRNSHHFANIARQALPPSAPAVAASTTRNHHNRGKKHQQLAHAVPKPGQDKLELEPENYTAYVLVQLFDAFYVPWLKECNAKRFAADFASRLDHLNQSLESAFPTYSRFKSRIVPLARCYCFSLLRKLKVSIDDVYRCSALGERHKVKNKCLRVRIVTKNVTNSVDESFYNSNYPIQLQSAFSMFLDIPIEMNDGYTELNVQFLFTDYDPLLEQQPSADAFLDHEVLLDVKEHEISGFTGYSTKLTVFDETAQESVEFSLTLTWDLNIKSITEQVKWLEVVANNFSCALLALGTYFWRFYCSLYTSLLLYGDSEIAAIKILNEVIFLLGSQQRMALFKPLLKLLEKHLLPVEMECPMPLHNCNPDVCGIQYRLVHGVYLILEHLAPEDQLQLIAKLRLQPFSHLLRFNCAALSLDQLIMLQRVLLRRLAMVVKKSKLKTREQVEPYFDLLIDALVDSVKLPDLAVAQMEDEMCSMRDDTAHLLASFYLRIEDVKSENDGDTEEEEEHSGSESADQPRYEQLNSSKNCPKEPSMSGEEKQDFKKTGDIESKYFCDQLALEHFSANSNSEQPSDSILLQSILPPSVMAKLHSEEMLTPAYYQATLDVMRKVHTHLEKLRANNSED